MFKPRPITGEAPVKTVAAECEGAAPETATLVLKEDRFIAYEVAVQEARIIVNRREKDGLRLGELADLVKPIYGEKTMRRFALDIGVAQCTLERHRDTFRRWKEISAPGRESLGYSVARELATHPCKAELLAAHPNGLTKRKARQIMRALKTKRVEEQDAEDFARDLLVAANKARGLAPENPSPEKVAQASRLLGVVQAVEQTAQAWTEIADQLRDGGDDIGEDDEPETDPKPVNLVPAADEDAEAA